jgi:hypothetical protein
VLPIGTNSPPTASDRPYEQASSLGAHEPFGSADSQMRQYRTYADQNV